MGCLGQVTIVTIVTLRTEALCCGMPGAGYHSNHGYHSYPQDGGVVLWVPGAGYHSYHGYHGYHCYPQDGGVVLWDAWGRLP